MSASTADPFDTSQLWPIDRQSTTTRPRPNYSIQLEEPSVSPNESPVYSNNRYAASTSSDITQTYNNMTTLSRNNSINPNKAYGALPSLTYANTNSLNMERNLPTSEPTLATTLAEMSLDDRISESLNLRKNTNENIYANSSYSEAPGASSSQSASNNDRYNDIPIYNNFESNSAQHQFILETKDYYTKLSTPTGVRTKNDYEKNIYIPKYEEEAEKLQNFSESLENSKNYSAMKYQNVDYGQYFYASSFGSTSGYGAGYDEVNDAASNFYSEIGESGSRSVYGDGRATYTNAGLYDEVYEAPPRPHRPAPPCPTKPK